MLLRQLRSLATVAEHGRVMRATTTLRLAQPALSRQLQSLEQAVGTSLLIREPRGVRLTGAGKSLLSAIGPLFERLQDPLSRVYPPNHGPLAPPPLAPPPRATHRTPRG